MLKRAAQPQLSLAGQKALDDYATALREREDLRPVTVRNYLSDLRQFAAWYETTAMAGMADAEAEQGTMTPFGFPIGPQEITTPTITRYREYLQHTCELKPASVNRALISIKRYCAWRLRYFGGTDRWGFAFYTYSSNKYELSVFPTGEFLGKPEEALAASALFL